MENFIEIYSVSEGEKLLRQAANAYYNGVPIMEDGEYDGLWRRHMEARRKRPGDPFWETSILNEVGAAPAPTSGFRKVKHAYPMLSLDNVFENDQDGSEDLEKWLAGVEKVCGPGTEIVVEPKIDGLSLSLTYINGVLLSAVTRGDGTTGDDVTNNVRASAMLPTNVRPLSDTAMTIPALGPATVRGEVFMDFATFDRLNAELIANGEEPYKNPRNAAAGALRLQDPSECEKRGLRFLPHGVADGGFRYHSEAMSYLSTVGFHTMQGRIYLSPTGKDGNRLGSISELRKLVTAGVDYPIDGLVFKVNDYAKRELMGSTSRAPRWATALKFQQEKVTTILKGITVQVGRGGSLTPVGELEPVRVDGSTVSRATLHNEDQINRLGLQIGDIVEIHKAGGVIPEITGSVTLREEATKAVETMPWGTASQEEMLATVKKHRPPFNLLTHLNGKCPSCNGTDIQKQPVAGEDGVRYQCCNPDCPAQLAARIEHFASRKCLDIEMLGGEAATALADYLISSNADDIYTGWDSPRSATELLLSFMDFGVPSFARLSWITDSGTQMTLGEKRAEKIVASLRRAKTLPLHRWLFALGIPTIGENTSKEISRLSKNPEDLRWNFQRGCIFDILATPHKRKENAETIAKYQVSSHLGPVSSEKLREFVHSKEGDRILMMIYNWGVKSDNYNPEPKVSSDKPLFGKTVCITGTLSIGRDEMKALLEAAGAKIVGSVSKKLTFLVAGEDCGSKLDKAKECGVTILTEPEIRGML